MNRVQRILGHKLSVEQVLETLMWLALPYLVIGLVWTFFHPEQVQVIEASLLTKFPAGADLVAFGQVTLLWPVLLLGADVCIAM
ncbi:hypothetical protein [Mycolicibacterium fortuitum]|jgi:hypothetical protein|uniref:Uncharacterized protein n=2 Tax=Mycolicibacterium fortuitum TaxID=1766 RepID=A0A0N9XEL3_MYCFO|nr:hypothetical protein [Mycolicibacterium fortuitum]AIY46872.1 hypothetical protein G155_16370 [Mycobacterium sp. VKM Ac-1817D]ALI27181.1 hypothetical protein XA26_33540 [Mycolicibacterium fortuitum]AMD55020.1 hypothetical protein ATO49_15715 [Mycolicibacterium fortuitum subsp. fortuitum DSM 46621 = ATCC 6841 = JCM 6387]EJZ15474.1 hypothetical protein MFORT_04523 [Mycolicibacterium fortuitum subsp. fortuitum DSM 46621 = ATCC 6841 = JCM 6387]MBP3083995.1 hypothetical protein [Mycolicibacterium